MSFNSTSGSFMAMRATCRPMRPKPLMPIPVACIAVFLLEDALRPAFKARAAAQPAMAAHAAPATKPGDSVDDAPATWPRRFAPASPACARRLCVGGDGATNELDAYHAPAAAATKHPVRAMAVGKIQPGNWCKMDGNARPSALGTP